MATPFHLELLREGTQTWNTWLNTPPYVVADFSEANLEHLHLDNAHLIIANFVGANLSQATFQGAWLRLDRLPFTRSVPHACSMQWPCFSRCSAGILDWTKEGLP